MNKYEHTLWNCWYGGGTYVCMFAINLDSGRTVRQTENHKIVLDNVVNMDTYH